MLFSVKVIVGLGLLTGAFLIQANQSRVFTAGEGAVIQEISMRVLTEAYKKIGIDVKVEIMPNARALKSANNGDFDGDVSRVKSIESKFANLIRIPIEINYLQAQAFSVNKTLPVNGWDSLRGKRLISVLGTKFVENNLKQRNIPCDFLSTAKQAMEMLNRGRADAAILPLIVGINASRDANTPMVIPVGRPLMRLGLYHYINKKHQATAEKLTDVLKAMKNTGRLAEIREQYIEEHNY